MELIITLNYGRENYSFFNSTLYSITDNNLICILLTTISVSKQSKHIGHENNYNFSWIKRVFLSVGEVNKICASFFLVVYLNGGDGLPFTGAFRGVQARVTLPEIFYMCVTFREARRTSSAIFGRSIARRKQGELPKTIRLTELDRGVLSYWMPRKAT